MKHPTPYELSMLVVAKGDTSDKGIANALDLYRRATDAIVRSEKQDATTEAHKKKNERVSFDDVTQHGKAHFVAAKESTLLKYIIERNRRQYRVVDGITPGDPAENARLSMPDYKQHGFSLREVETLQAIRREMNAQRGKANRTPKTKPKRKTRK